MRIPSWLLTVIAMVALSVAFWSSDPAPTRANGEKDEDKGGHAHVPAPLEYADVHVPPSVWTDAAMIARGKEIYTARCAVCHGDAGDGKGPAGVALPLKPSDFRDKAGVAEMRDNYWFWRLSQGRQDASLQGKGPAITPSQGELSDSEGLAIQA